MHISVIYQMNFGIKDLSVERFIHFCKINTIIPIVWNFTAQIWDFGTVDEHWSVKSISILTNAALSFHIFYLSSFSWFIFHSSSFMYLSLVLIAFLFCSLAERDKWGFDCPAQRKKKKKKDLHNYRWEDSLDGQHNAQWKTKTWLLWFKKKKKSKSSHSTLSSPLGNFIHTWADD